ncbi:MAG: AlpA family transcriptional regulator [Pseudomonadota bacterium]
MTTAAPQAQSHCVAAPTPHERILRWPEVQERTGLCRSHVHDMAKRGQFPAPIKLGGRASGWLESEISAWIEERKASARGDVERREARRS